jgi:acetylornithine deacetylase/succinyl-diaminopimelate desuccinylase-like protein
MTDLISRILDLAIAIQQIPAPTFHEADRAEFVRSHFVDEGLADVEVDGLGNVYARLAGSGSEKVLVVSAHLDTVFPSSVDLHFEREPESRLPSENRDYLAGTGTTSRIIAPGIGDNSLGVAGLFGLVWALRQRGLTLPGDLWLVANVGEEGLGDLRGMKSLVGRFGTTLAYIVLEGLALGQVYHRGLGVRRYRITVHTSGGHSWIDYGQPSAIHELTALSTHIAALQLPTTPRTTLNIGVISGGSSVNTIAAEAMLELDLRSESTETLEALAGQVEQLVRAAQKPGVTIETEIIGQRPSGALPAEHPLVRLAQDCLRRAGIEPHLNTGSTDANLPLSLGLPSITIGLTTGGRAHTVHEFINIPPLEKGMDQVLQLVSKVWDTL